MCDSCGCGDTNLVPVEVQQRILSDNERTAAHNRQHFVERALLAINVMGSPGAGKTAVLEATARALAGRRLLGALAGDLATDNDAGRLAGRRHPRGVDHHRLGVPSRRRDGASRPAPPAVAAISTISSSRTSATSSARRSTTSGRHANVVVLSVTEGEDKPLKYPVMFHKADLVLISKIDLLPHLPEISLERIVDALGHVMPEPRYIAVSARTGQGIDEWVDAGCASRRRLPSLRGRAHDHGHACLSR